jgi:Spy/CpxP family protein refolding chaperone
MNRRVMAASFLLAAAVAAFAQGTASDRQPPKPAGQGPAPRQDQPAAGQKPPAGGGGYSIEQSISDKAQLSTIAFSGLAFMTGTFEADTFLPPGKAADYFGFQYMRDIDAAEAGHNQMFLTNIGNNVLAILTSEQKARFLALAKEQAGLYQALAEKRLVLIKAFRRNLEGAAPAGSAGLSEAAVKAYVADIFEIDGNLSFRRAETYGVVAAALTAAQKAAMAKLKFGDSATLPELPDQYDKRTMSHEEDVLFMTYASEFFSWYAGSVDADVYFCPERHATYFGGFYMKDEPAMNNRGYFIPTALTGDSGEEFLAILSDAQRAEVVGIMDTLPGLLRSIVELRRTVSIELRKFLVGGTADRSTVLRLSRTYGELDGEISWQCATRFADAYRTLTAAQKAALVKLRNQDVFPKGVYLYSTEVAAPGIADTAFLFAK